MGRKFSGQLRNVYQLPRMTVLLKVSFRWSDYV